ncbi:MAG: DUF2207 domain-containing protein [Alphaproteobacteria bacterium]|nr:DUF2207 domain-containing protein [Alphaproteobacteria bacterium]
MKNFFLILAFCLIGASALDARPREFNSMDEAKASASHINREILEKAQQQEKLPVTNEEMREFVRSRMDKVDIMTFPEEERLDRISSFSKVSQDDDDKNKSMWEKMYDKAMERLGRNPGVNTEALQPVKYYTLAPEKTDGNEDTPMVNVQLSDGSMLQAPAYEHIPYFASQIDVLPNGMIKIYENVVVVANGRKVKEPISRFIDKKNASGRAKYQVSLESVKVNDTLLPYELVETNSHFVIAPKYKMKLPEGVYIFEFSYVIDRYLMDIGDFYEFYWNVTGGNYNLVTSQVIVAVRLPGREPAVKYYALTGLPDNLVDNNAVTMVEKDNIQGFVTLYPLMQGEGMHLFLTVPKVDFTPLTSSQRILNFLEIYGDIVLAIVYFGVVAISCALSWVYIRKKLKFRNIVLPSPLSVRYLWRGGADNKSVGCFLLDLYRKNIIEIEARDEEVILVRKTAHSKHLSKFEKKIMALLFSKKDSLCRLSKNEQIQMLKKLVKQKSVQEVNRLGFKLTGMYILFNLLMLAAVEIGLIFWNPTSVLAGLLVLVDVLLGVMIGSYLFIKGTLWRRVLCAIVSASAMILAMLILTVYLSWTAIIFLFAGVWIAVIFNQKASGKDAMLKNAVRSTYQMREFLLEQKESICNGRNFVIQQANIFALDVEDEYPNNDKIKSTYRLDMIKALLAKIN